MGEITFWVACLVSGVAFGYACVQTWLLWVSPSVVLDLEVLICPACDFATDDRRLADHVAMYEHLAYRHSREQAGGRVGELSDVLLGRIQRAPGCEEFPRRV